MERQARDYFDRIESLGGVVPAIEKGFFQKEIAAAAYKYQQEIDNKERIVVGVNQYNSEEQVEIPILEMDPKGYERQCARLKKLRSSRDKGRRIRSNSARAWLESEGIPASHLQGGIEAWLFDNMNSSESPIAMANDLESSARR